MEFLAVALVDIDFPCTSKVMTDKYKPKQPCSSEPRVHLQCLCNMRYNRDTELLDWSTVQCVWKIRTEARMLHVG